jgi:ABC-2 type transport system ATP-binding protein
VIEVNNLTKIYGANRGLLPLTLTIAAGEFVAIVGHNGAGKSTLLKILANWLRPDSGTVQISGTPLTNRLAAVRQVGFVPETPNLYELFSVESNLTLFAKLFALPKSRVETILRDFNLTAFRRSKVQSLSKGLRQRVSLSRSLLPDPPVLLFDEPTSGLDFEITKEVYSRLKSLHAAGKTILFTSHRPEEVRMFATRIIVLHAGAVIFDGAPEAYFTSKAHDDLYQLS